MHPQERYSDLEETLRILSDGILSQVWTCFPAVVTAITNNGNTVEVQPAVNGRARQPQGTYKYLQLPKLTDVPLVFPRGGGATFTFPVAVNDEVLVHIASRCIDAWWKQGFSPPAGATGADGKPFNPANNPPRWRVNNLSDAFAVPGLISNAKALNPAPSTSAAQLRNADGTAYLSFNPTTKALSVLMPGGITLNGVTIDSSSNIANAANITGTGTVTGQTEVVSKTGGSAVHLSTHTHSSSGAGPPNPGT